MEIITRLQFFLFDKMIHFYRDVLGLEILSESDNLAPPEGNHTGIPGAHRYLVFVGKQDSTHRLELVHFIEPPSPSGHLERNQLGASHVLYPQQPRARHRAWCRHSCPSRQFDSLPQQPCVHIDWLMHHARSA